MKEATIKQLMYKYQLTEEQAKALYKQHEAADTVYILVEAAFRRDRQ